MRIVTKVNLTLLAALTMAAGLNFVVLQTTIMPSFGALESTAAERNEDRAAEAIETIEARIASTARDYAFWDDTFSYLNGAADPNRAGEAYPEGNFTRDAMKALDLDYAALIDASGRVVIDRSFAGGQSREAPAKPFLGLPALPPGHPLLAPFATVDARAGLMMGPDGLMAVALAPVQTSQRSGSSPGRLVLGRLIDVAELKEVTRVDIHIEPRSGTAAAPMEPVPLDDVVEVRRPLEGLDGAPLATLVTHTPKRISGLGASALRWAMGLMVLSMLVVGACVGIALRRIAIRRIERIGSHLSGVTRTGELAPMPEDRAGDELSETVASFNTMAAQLSDLRSELRRKDYRHGAADLAAGLLHNIRNAVSPVAAIVWDLDRREKEPWKLNLAKALEQLADTELDAERAAKLKELVVLSAGESLKASAARQTDLRVMHEMIRHVEEILREEDRLAKSDSKPELVRVDDAVARALRRIDRLGVVATADVAPGTSILGHRVVLDQILDNLLVNAAQAIEAAHEPDGRIVISAGRVAPGGAAAVEIVVSDNGDGILPEHVDLIFGHGFSTRRERSGGLGLHWCANAAKSMNGSLSAESAGRGTGATMRLVLPAAASERRSAA